MHDYARHDATALAALLRAGQVTADELLDAALARATTVNPALNALVLMQEDAARRMIAAGLPAGPFTGVPFVLKDLLAGAVDFPSHNGSNLLRGTVYDHDDEIYVRMRATGVVPFCRATAPEGGVGPVTEAAVYGGPTRNPWDLSRTPGGSSGGSAAAVAAGVVPMAHGSDGGGSIRIPASCCGLFGFKPTRARLPDGPDAGEGWAGMATDGVLTRSVRDTAAMLDACAGADLGAPYHAPPLGEGYAAAITRPPSRLRIALCATRFDGAAVHPDCAAAAQDAARLLTDMGHHITEARPQADHVGMMRAWTRIVACGTALWIRQALAGRALRPGDVEGVARGAVRYAEGIGGADYLEAVNEVHAFGREVAAFWKDHDILLTPTLAEPPCLIGRFDHRTEDYEGYRIGPDGVFAYSPFTAAFNATGQPAASVPLHWNAEGLPIGVHLAARFGADETLIALCAELEQARPWAQRRPPEAALAS